MRVTGDVDVLIGRDDYALALATLEGAGLHRMAPAFRDGLGAALRQGHRR